jgi:hypothetical protein
MTDAPGVAVGAVVGASVAEALAASDAAADGAVEAGAAADGEALCPEHAANSSARTRVPARRVWCAIDLASLARSQPR